MFAVQTWGDTPRFAPVAVPEHLYSGGWEHFVGGGLAAFDCDDDDLPELFAAGGTTPALLLRNRSDKAGPIRLERSARSGLELTGVSGAYPLDIDGDGRIDLAMLRAGPNKLMRGLPDCRFEPFDSLGFTSPDAWTTAFSATWEAGRTLPSLFFGNYVDRNDPKGPFSACDINRLYRAQNGRYTAPTSLEPGFCPLSALFSDWARRGRADLRLSNDRHYYVREGAEQLWAMAPTPWLYGVEDGWQRHQLWGMGIAAQDIDRDGQQEVFLTSMGDQRLQRLSPGATGPHYLDVPYSMGTTATTPYAGGDGRPSTGWHVAIGDVQNDGLPDIFIAKGNVDQMPDSAWNDPNNLLLGQPDGRYVEAGGDAGLGSLHRGRGAVLADLNADGLLDIAVVNRRAAMEVWQNRTASSGNWLNVDLRQDGPNTRAIGAWIELDDGLSPIPKLREITVGGGHAGGQSTGAHFGLGHVTQLRIRVIWPDGVASEWMPSGVNRYLRITRPER